MKTENKNNYFFALLYFSPGLIAFKLLFYIYNRVMFFHNFYNQIKMFPREITESHFYIVCQSSMMIRSAQQRHLYISIIKVIYTHLLGYLYICRKHYSLYVPKIVMETSSFLTFLLWFIRFFTI